MRNVVFRKAIDLTSLPASWNLVRIAAEWNGSPLMLFVDGKPARPSQAAISADPWVFTRWYQAPPTAHYAMYLRGNEVRTVCFERSQGVSTFHLQPLGKGWLLADRRGGRGNVYDEAGLFLRSIDLGDASEDIQTTPDDRIWVSYFDEGVFGGGIGKQGVVCFDSIGNPVFQYGDFAERNGLPFISDCYAVNVTASGDVWLNYYTDFPLVQLRGFALEHCWSDFGVTGNGFAVKEDAVIYGKEAHVFSRLLESPHKEEMVHPEDESGMPLVPLSTPHLGHAFRGAHIVLNTGSAVYVSVVNHGLHRILDV
jgi:hypothetical protein